VRPKALVFDFGITDLMLLGPADHEVYLVEFRCRCAVVVARGQVIRAREGSRSCASMSRSAVRRRDLEYRDHL